MEKKELVRRPSKTSKIESNENWEIIFGTFNKQESKTVFVEFKTWLTPLDEEFLKSLYIIKRNITAIAPPADKFIQRVITVYDIADTKMALNKPSLFKGTIHFIQTGCLSYDEIKNEVIMLLSNLLNSIEKKTGECFKFSRNKK
jgi:hypothetical protein